MSDDLAFATIGELGVALRSGAVSPSARAMPMIAPVSMPGNAFGNT